MRNQKLPRGIGILIGIFIGILIAFGLNKIIQNRSLALAIGLILGIAFGLIFEEIREGEIQKKVKIAKKAQKEWQKTSFKERSELLERVAQLVEKYKKEIAKTISGETKKIEKEAIEDCEFAKKALLFFAKKCPQYLAPEKIEHDPKEYPNRETYLYFGPVGVVGAIKPWNFPFDLPIWSCIGPAIMAGNSVILKPSPITPKTGQWIEKLFEEAGAPKGLLQVIPGGDDVGRELVLSDVDMVSFTGSTKVGKEIALEAAKRMKKFVLEMGSKDVAIVLEDCDFKKTIKDIVFHGISMNNGQVCTRIERVLIQKRIYNKFIEKLAERIKASPSRPFALKMQFEIAKNHLKEAIEKGCRVITGGKILDEEKWIIEPTLIECLEDDLAIWKEETFGPVLAIRPFEDIKQAIKIANNCRYGLGASVWTQNKEKFLEIAKKLEVGMVWQNDANLSFFEGIWIGWKDSGFGYSLGKYGTRIFTKIKQVSAKLT
jgi:acyl-CoA reductase-like NAD-dependent aldehyde dehydrogenase